MIEMRCPTCTSPMERIELAPRGIILGVCKPCGEFGQQLPNGEMIPMSEALQALAMGDDRIRAAISKPRPVTLKSFLDIYEIVNRLFAMELASNMGSLRTLLAQIENRLDTAISAAAEMAFVGDQGTHLLALLREARELVSTLPRKNRGPREEPEPERPPE